MITVKNNVFHLATRHMSHVFLIDRRGLAESLFTGRRLSHPEEDVHALTLKRLAPRPGELSLGPDDWEINLNDLPLEFSTEGRGDFRESFIAIEKDSSAIPLDLRYVGHECFRGIKRMESGLVQALAGEEEAQGVRVDFADGKRGIALSLVYTLFPSHDVITRRAIVRNSGEGPVTVRRLASLQLDLFDAGYSIVTVGGPWGRENRREERSVSNGIWKNVSRSGFTGQSSSTIQLEKGDNVYTLGLLYPGDHEESVETTVYGKTHVLVGMGSGTNVPLASGDSFETAEAFMIHSASPREAQDRLKLFIRTLIMRGVWRDRLRPISFSTDEALGLDTQEDRVLQQIKLASRLGFELFVLGDGWFGVRNTKDDSLGDWSANTLKLPGGLANISKACHREGMLFGIWIRPETASLKSRYAMDHPQWLVGDGSDEGGAALIDLTDSDAYNSLLEQLKELIERTGIDCLRWQLAVHMSATCTRKGKPLPPTWRMDYIKALTRLQRSLSVAFPNLLIENVTGSAGRFEASQLASCATMAVNSLSDPFEQLDSIMGASMIVPPASVKTSMTLGRMPGRQTSFSEAFDIAFFGCPDYSLDLKALSHGQRQTIGDQIAFYKQYREVAQYGDYSVREENGIVTLSSSSPDRSTILALVAVRRATVNSSDFILRIDDADESALYRVCRREDDRSKAIWDDEKRPEPESEAYIVGGDTLKWAGLRLAEAWMGGAYSDGMRVMGDSSTRLYVIRRIERS